MWGRELEQVSMKLGCCLHIHTLQVSTGTWVISTVNTTAPHKPGWLNLQMQRFGYRGAMDTGQQLEVIL